MTAHHTIALQEQILISAALEAPRAVPALAIEPEDFLAPQAQRVWRVMQRLARGDGWRGERELAAQCASVADEAPAYESYLAECASTLGKPRDMQAYADLVRRASVTRGFRAIGESIERHFRDGLEGQDLITATMRDVAALERRVVRNKKRTGEDLLNYLDETTVPGSDDEVRRRVPMGFGRIDRAIGGWPCGVVSVVGGDTGMGKSSVMVQSAVYASQHGYPALVVSTEDLESDTGYRLWAQDTGVPATALRVRADLSKEQEQAIVTSRSGRSKYAHLSIDAVGRITAEEIVSRVRLDQHKDGTAIVFVDYLQRLKLPSGVNRYEGLGHAMQIFDYAAKEDGMPWVVGSQLKRSDNRYPELHDFRDSGMIEEIAKLAIGIYRPGHGKAPDEDCSMLIKVLKASNAPCVQAWHEWVPERAEILDRPPPEVYQ